MAYDSMACFNIFNIRDWNIFVGRLVNTSVLLCISLVIVEDSQGVSVIDYN